MRESEKCEACRFIGNAKVKSTAFIASPPSARLFLGVQQRPRVGVFTHQRVTLAGRGLGRSNPPAIKYGASQYVLYLLEVLVA